MADTRHQAWTVGDISREVHVTPATIRLWNKTGKGPRGAYRVGRRILFPGVEVQRWIAERQAAENDDPKAERWVSDRGDYDRSTPAGRMYAEFLASVDHMERETTRRQAVGDGPAPGATVQ